MRHLIYYTSANKLSDLLERRDVATPQEQDAIEYDAICRLLEQPITTPEFCLHLRLDDEDIHGLRAHLATLTEADVVAVVYHSQSCAAPELATDWRNTERLLTMAFPAKQGRHGDPNGDGMFELYQALGRYLVGHLLSTPDPEPLNEIWNWFETGRRT